MTIDPEYMENLMENLESLKKGIESKIEQAVLFNSQYKQIADAYQEHIFGDATIERPKEKWDIKGYYGAINEFFNFEDEELDYLHGAGRTTVLDYTKRIFDKNAKGDNILQEIIDKEDKLEYSRKMDSNNYVDERKEDKRKKPKKEYHQKENVIKYGKKPGRRRRGKRK